MPVNRREVVKAGLVSPLVLGLSGCGGGPAMTQLDATDLESRRVTATTAKGTKIHAIQTGWVAVKSAHRTLKGMAALRIPAIMMDGTWTEWLPIHAWVIEHPSGVIVIDTGETAKTSDPEYFACDSMTGFFYTRNLRFAVRPQDEIGAQLKALGIPPEEVRHVVLTHLHSDHMGGLSWFPKSEITVPREDYPSSQGTLPCRYPDWFAPRFPVFRTMQDQALASAYDITPDGDVIIVPTNGHSDGHQSVLFLEDDTTYWFCGDTTFDERQLLTREVAGICSNIRNARASIERIRTYCTASNTVYLPTHDPESPDRLLKAQTTTIA